MVSDTGFRVLTRFAYLVLVQVLLPHVKFKRENRLNLVHACTDAHQVDQQYLYTRPL